MMCEPVLYDDDSEDDSSDSEEDSDVDLTWSRSRQNHKSLWNESKPKRTVRNRNSMTFLVMALRVLLMGIQVSVLSVFIVFWILSDHYHPE